MYRYETVLVIPMDLQEPQAKEELKKIEAFLQSHGAPQVKVDKWGPKQLGWPMHGKSMGVYYCLSFETDRNQLMEEFTGMLRIHAHVLKFQSHRISDKVRKFKGRVRTGGSSEIGDDSDDSVDYLPA